MSDEWDDELGGYDIATFDYMNNDGKWFLNPDEDESDYSSMEFEDYSWYNLSPMEKEEFRRKEQERREDEYLKIKEERLVKEEPIKNKYVKKSRIASLIGIGLLVLSFVIWNGCLYHEQKVKERFKAIMAKEVAEDQEDETYDETFLENWRMEDYYTAAEIKVIDEYFDIKERDETNETSDRESMGASIILLLIMFDIFVVLLWHDKTKAYYNDLESYNEYCSLESLHMLWSQIHEKDIKNDNEVN